MEPKKPPTKADLLAKAAEFREMAETALTPRTRDTLLQLATEYEALAGKRAEIQPEKPAKTEDAALRAEVAKLDA